MTACQRYERVHHYMTSRRLTNSLQLHTLIISASSRPIHNEPSEEQRKRVKALERKADAQRRIEKDKRSQTKKHRGSAKFDWD
jgi:peptidyl-tRNA hydrolase ICT1